jgi:hypothetical protein
MYNTNPEVGAGFFALPRVVRVVAAQPPVSCVVAADLALAKGILDRTGAARPQ